METTHFPCCMNLVCLRQLGVIIMLHSPLWLCLNEYKAPSYCTHDPMLIHHSNIQFIHQGLLHTAALLILEG